MKKGPPYDKNVSLLRESNNLMFFHKAADWAYEMEIRSVYNASSNIYMRFKGESFLSIITGPRMTEENKKRVAKMVRDSPLAHIQVRSARLSNNSFSVEID